MTNLPLTGIFNITATFKQVNKNLWKTLGFHTGLDFTGSDNIYATCDGIVDSINYSSAYGNYIIVKEDNANRYHYFCHLKNVKARKGQRVNRATIIGITRYPIKTTAIIFISAAQTCRFTVGAKRLAHAKVM